MPKAKKTTKKTKKVAKPKKIKKVKKVKKIEKAKKIKKVKKPVSKKKIEKPKPSVSFRYFEAVGRRKTAVARVRLWTKGEKEFLVNKNPSQAYFLIPEFQQTAKSSLKKMNCLDKFRVEILVKGGGLSAQAEAIRHGIARALIKFNPDFKKRLRKAGFLTRDPRMRERKKFGLKRARRAPQWRKR